MILILYVHFFLRPAMQHPPTNIEIRFLDETSNCENVPQSTNFDAEFKKNRKSLESNKRQQDNKSTMYALQNQQVKYASEQIKELKRIGDLIESRNSIEAEKLEIKKRKLELLERNLCDGS
jgi:hypothetical protein